MPMTTADDEQAAHRRRPLLDVVALRPLLADPLAEPERVQDADVRGHQDDHQGEREEQALDELDLGEIAGHRADGSPSSRRRPSTTASRPTPRDALTRTTSPSRRRGGSAASAASASRTRWMADAIEAGRLGALGDARRRRRRRPSASRRSGRRPRRPRGGRRRSPRRARASRRGPRRAGRAARPSRSSAAMTDRGDAL